MHPAYANNYRILFDIYKHPIITNKKTRIISYTPEAPTDFNARIITGVVDIIAEYIQAFFSVNGINGFLVINNKNMRETSLLKKYIKKVTKPNDDIYIKDRTTIIKRGPAEVGVVKLVISINKQRLTNEIVDIIIFNILTLIISLM